MLLSSGYSIDSWKKHSSALNSWKDFENYLGKRFTFPYKTENILEYIGWCHSVQKLKPSTVKSYISSLTTIHKLNDADTKSLNAALTKTAIKGIENLSLYDNMVSPTRKVMTFELLKLAGHEIAKKDWSLDSKQVIWTCTVIAFFGSLRLGEILCKNENVYNSNENLLWKDVIFREDGSILLRIKIAKNKKVQGEFIDLFEFPDHRFCPVKILKKLKSLKSKIDQSVPVFMFESGKLLTPTAYNKILPDLLFPYLGHSAKEYSGHSLRAGIPSILASNPDLASDCELKKWGRWQSDSYLLYCRLKLDQKKSLFNKIVHTMRK